MAKKEEREIEKEEIPREKRKIPTKLLLFGAAIIAVFLIAGYPAYYFYDKYQDAQLLLKNPKQAAQNEAESLLRTVGKLIELPKNETPTIATVSDKTKLSSQPFFAKAENGDKVLIYNKAKKAIIYRPKTNKIIEVSSINIVTDTLRGTDATGSASAKQEMLAKVVLLNGTTKTGLTKVAEDKILAANLKVEISDRDNASKNDLEETILVDVSKKNSELILSLQKTIGGKVGSVPESQPVPEGIDVLVILGQDFK